MQAEQKMTSSLSDYDAITRTVQTYIAGGRSGKGADMKPAFHPDATILAMSAVCLLGQIQRSSTGMTQWAGDRSSVSDHEH